MRRSIIKLVVGLTLCILSCSASSALINGSTLLIGSSSYFDFFGKNMINGVDGIKIGVIQTNTFDYPGLSSIDSWAFLGADGMHYTTNPTNINNSTGNTAEIDFSGWSWTFNGDLVRLNLGTGA